VKLTIVGSASAAPNPGSASSCYLIETEVGQVLLECGHGAAAKMLLYSSLDRIAAIAISHMHPDHFFDLVPMKYLIQRAGHPRLPLFVPPTGPGVLAGVAAGLGENGTFWEKAYEIHVFDPDASLELPGLTATMTPTHHFIPAWAMRFRDKETGRVLGYTSDTSLTEGVVEHVRGCDLLLAEASLEQQTRSDEEQGHLTGSEAGDLAAQAGVGRLVLTHYPQVHSEQLLAAAKENFPGECDLAVEGKQYRI